MNEVIIAEEDNTEVFTCTSADHSIPRTHLIVSKCFIAIIFLVRPKWLGRSVMSSFIHTIAKPWLV